MVFLKKQMVVLAAVLCVFMVASVSSAFLFEVKILDKKAIAALSDEDLSSIYIDVEVEVEALQAFYAKGGLTPKDYKSFKEILRYRILLTDELQKRGLNIPGRMNPAATAGETATGSSGQTDQKKAILIKE